MDPMTVIATITAGLKLVDQFSDLTRKLLGRPAKENRVNVSSEESKITIQEKGVSDIEVRPSDLALGEFDKIRHDALFARVHANWELYFGISTKVPLAADDEKVRLTAKMNVIKGELCDDFRQLVRMYELVLRTSLADHFSLYDVCGIPIPTR